MGRKLLDLKILDIKMLGNIGELSCFPLDEANKYCCATTRKSESSSRNDQVRKLKLERGNCEVNL